MPAKGKPKLTDEKRVAIILDKRTGLDTVKTIAEDHGITERHVYKVEQNASEKVLSMVEIAEKSLAERIASVRDKALQKINERLDSDDAPLNHLTTAFGVTYDKHRLETDKPTQIVRNDSDAQTQALNFLQMLLRHGYSRENALDQLRTVDLAPLVSNESRDRTVKQLCEGSLAWPVVDVISEEQIA